MKDNREVIVPSFEDEDEFIKWLWENLDNYYAYRWETEGMRRFNRICSGRTIASIAPERKKGLAV